MFTPDPQYGSKTTFPVFPLESFKLYLHCTHKCMYGQTCILIQRLECHFTKGFILRTTSTCTTKYIHVAIKSTGSFCESASRYMYFTNFTIWILKIVNYICIMCTSYILKKKKIYWTLFMQCLLANWYTNHLYFEITVLVLNFRTRWSHMISKFCFGIPCEPVNHRLRLLLSTLLLTPETLFWTQLKQCEKSEHTISSIKIIKLVMQILAHHLEHSWTS